MRRPRYTISITLNGTTHTATATSHHDCGRTINDTLGYPLVSTNVIINWLSRKSKSPKYDFITIQKQPPTLTS